VKTSLEAWFEIPLQYERTSNIKNPHRITTGDNRCELTSLSY
jgi:hypothetical protein